MARHLYPQFTRRDYQFIADILAESQPDMRKDSTAALQWEVTVLTFARNLRRTNSRFDQPRFLAACGYVETRT